MKITHVALWTNNLEKMRDFYVKYFRGKSGKKYVNPKKKFASYFLTFGSEATLELMTIPGLARAKKTQTITGWSHIAFSVGSREAVTIMTRILKDSGYLVVGEPRVTGDGFFESCILDPEGNRVEITE